MIINFEDYKRFKITKSKIEESEECQKIKESDEKEDSMKSNSSITRFMSKSDTDY